MLRIAQRSSADKEASAEEVGDHTTVPGRAQRHPRQRVCRQVADSTLVPETVVRFAAERSPAERPYPRVMSPHVVVDEAGLASTTGSRTRPSPPRPAHARPLRRGVPRHLPTHGAGHHVGDRDRRLSTRRSAGLRRRRRRRPHCLRRSVGQQPVGLLRQHRRAPARRAALLVPGVGETLRINGRATVTTDPAVLAATAIDGVQPKVAVGSRSTSASSIAPRRSAAAACGTPTRGSHPTSGRRPVK